jgi:integrase
VRVPPEGPLVFAAVARGPYGKQVWATLGSTAELRIEQAREAIRRIKAGRPAFEPPPPKTDGVATVLADWLKRRVHKAGMRRAAEYERIIRVYVLPHWADRAFEELRRSDVAKLLDYVEDQHGPAQADAVLSVLRMVGSWWRDRSDDYVSPFSGIKSRVPLQHRRRDRVLADDELRRIWTACDQLDAFGALVKLLLLSGQRLEKVRTLRWNDISPDGPGRSRPRSGRRAMAASCSCRSWRSTLSTSSRASPAIPKSSPAMTARRARSGTPIS